MILSNKQSKAIGLDRTVDLKFILAREYVDSIENKGVKNKLANWFINPVFIAGIVNLVIVGMIALSPDVGAKGAFPKVEKGEVIKFETNGKNLTNATLKWTTGSWHLVTVYERQVKILQELGYSKTRILDLLAFRAMECNREDGKCKGLKDLDIGPFQINSVHRVDYKKSRELWNDEVALFTYQAKVANGLLDAYEKNYCGEEHFKKIGKTYNNKERFKCYARCYNGGKHRIAYGERAYSTRGIVKHFYNLNF